MTKRLTVHHGGITPARRRQFADDAKRERAAVQHDLAELAQRNVLIDEPTHGALFFAMMQLDDSTQSDEQYSAWVVRTMQRRRVPAEWIHAYQVLDDPAGRWCSVVNAQTFTAEDRARWIAAVEQYRAEHR
jgi:hypothetical protein